MNAVAKQAILTAFIAARSRVGAAEAVERQTALAADRAISAHKAAKRELAALRETMTEHDIPVPEEAKPDGVVMSDANGLYALNCANTQGALQAGFGQVGAVQANVDRQRAIANGQTVEARR